MSDSKHHNILFGIIFCCLFLSIITYTSLNLYDTTLSFHNFEVERAVRFNLFAYDSSVFEHVIVFASIGSYVPSKRLVSVGVKVYIGLSLLRFVFSILYNRKVISVNILEY